MRERDEGTKAGIGHAGTPMEAIDRRAALSRLAVAALAPLALMSNGASLAAAALPAIPAGPPGPPRRPTGTETHTEADAALARFAALPATASCLVDVGVPGAPWQLAHDPDRHLFIGSAIKTFILAQYLRDVEAGRLSEDAQMTVDDSVRTPGSPVLVGMSGTLPARSALEAMITHSDNIGTDIALAAATPARVRALIAEAGLKKTQIPDSTRRFFSWIAGAASGVDIGWDGMQRIEEGWRPGTPRSPLNDEQTLASTSSEMVHWYRDALSGRFFARPDTLREFRRIQAMADALSQVVPDGIASYGKGGSVDWERFHCFSLPGQMIVRGVPVTFCFTINWSGPDEGVATMFGTYRDAVAGVLAAVAARIGAG
jgi:beta-lactamase class A